jgi:hypothetical protein
MFYQEEDAIKFFEEYYEKIKAKRVKLNRYRPRKPETRDKYDVLLDNADPESLMGEEWILDEENARKYFKNLDENTTRYPHGFRHYENFASYKLVQPDTEIQDYITEMNSQCEFEAFLSI